MNIALDIDGVIIDFVGSFIATVERRLGYTLNYEDIYCHDISQVLALPKSDVNELVHETLEQNHFKLVDQAQKAVSHLNQHYNVFLITGRQVSYKQLTEELLAQHKIPYKALYFSKYLEKHQVDVHFDIFVEDSVEEAVSLSQKGGHILLYHHPWNARTINTKNLFKRVYNWKDILNEVESLPPSPPISPLLVQ